MLSSNEIVLCGPNGTKLGPDFLASKVLNKNHKLSS